MGKDKFQKCPACDGSGHTWDYKSQTVCHCETCRGTGQVAVVDAPERTEADERRREFFTGENT